VDKTNPSIFTVDFETTGKEAADAYAIEAALACPDDGAYGYETFISLPDGVTIPPETSAVHHIVEADLVGAPDWDTVVDGLWGAVSLGGELSPEQVGPERGQGTRSAQLRIGQEFDHWRVEGDGHRFIGLQDGARLAHRPPPGFARPISGLWVYGRGGRPCRRCGTIVEQGRQGELARLTFWCPRCQPSRVPT